MVEQKKWEKPIKSSFTLDNLANCVRILYEMKSPTVMHILSSIQDLGPAFSVKGLCFPDKGIIHVNRVLHELICW